MEARYKPKKVVEASVSKKPRELLVKRKTLRHNFRPPTEKKRDLPPLTPLHRLQRFKAIRDKNLKSKLRKTLSQNIFLKKMEETGSVTLKICEKETGATNSDSVIVCSLKPLSPHEKTDMESQNGELFVNGHKNPEEKVANGLELNNAEKENPVDVAENTKELIPNGNKNESQSFEDAQEEMIESKANEISGTIKTQNDTKESIEETYKEEGHENFPESDRESTASSSTFTSNKEFLQSSSDEMLEALPDKTVSADEDEEVDIERISSTEDETKPSFANKGEELEQKKGKEREKEIQKVESKKTSYQSRIPRSLSSASSASSYKSAYGSLSRISGRRPVMARGRKRPAEDESSERRVSLSEPSPRWRFVRAVPGLWSTPNLPSASAKGFRNINDSMTVNVNEESINCNLNDPDLFSDSKEIPPSKKSRWGCRIM